MGSGQALRLAFKKYGINNFKKEILEYFNSEEELYAREKEIVNEDFIKRSDTYNVIKGGTGQWSYVNKFINSNEFMTKIGKLGNDAFQRKVQNDLEFRNTWKTKISKGIKNFYKNNPEAKYKNKYKHNGYKHSEETKLKMREIKKKNLPVGDKNSQYGTMWICNLDLRINKKISKYEQIPDGWIKGRKVKINKCKNTNSNYLSLNVGGQLNRKSSRLRICISWFESKPYKQYFVLLKLY